MMKHFTYLFATLFIFTYEQNFAQQQHANWQLLFNGKNLSGWDTYIGPDLDSNGKFITGIPVGLNKDPRHVFSIVKDHGENIIRISGENWGAITTQHEFANYHLQLKFKWGSLTWGSKKGKKRDGGLLYHAVGKDGADYGAWMRSQEFQIEETNCGDYWGVAGGTQDIPVVKNSDSQYVYNPAGTLYTFNEKSKTGRHCIKMPDAEKPSGEWNIIDLYCYGDTSVHVVNGKVVMVLYHSGQLENGSIIPLTKGKLQLQSEGAEMFYKDIKIQTIDKMPEGLITP